jgi:hypothetical protein
MCLVLNGYRERGGRERELFQSNSFRFLFVGLDKCEIYKRKVDTRDGLLVHIIETTATIKKRDDNIQTNNVRSSHTSC